MFLMERLVRQRMTPSELQIGMLVYRKENMDVKIYINLEDVWYVPRLRGS